MDRPVFQLYYDPRMDRLVFDDWGIHCGNTFEVLIARDGEPVWVEARFEFSDRWYMLSEGKTLDVSPIGLFARSIR